MTRRLEPVRVSLLTGLCGRRLDAGLCPGAGRGAGSLPCRTVTTTVLVALVRPTQLAGRRVVLGSFYIHDRAARSWRDGGAVRSGVYTRLR